MATVELAGRVVLFRMRSDHFCKLPPSERFRLELLDGEVLMTPRPTGQHQYFLAHLAAALISWVKSRRIGRVLIDTLMKLDGNWTPAPDIVFLKTRHLKRMEGKRIVGPVDLAIEILSPSDEAVDRERKFAAYARFGIPWYWIVDLENRALEEYKLAVDKYGDVVRAPFDRPFVPRLFPGLKIDLASLEW